MVKPKRFELRNPYKDASGNYYCDLFIEPKHHELVRNQPYILNIVEFTTMPTKLLITIDPRYDYEEAWLELYSLLESETQKVELDSVWGLDTETEE